MRFENEFEVDAAVDEVWRTVLDVERVAPTVPGAKVLEQTAENAYKVAIKIRLGPMTMQYQGDVEIVDSDPESHRAVMSARAKESRGQGTADAEVTMQLTGDDTRTSGRIVTEMKVSGKAASMGRGVMQDVAGRMVGTFSENLAAMLSAASAGSEEPAPASGETGPAGDTSGGEGRPAPAAASSSDEGGDALDLGSLGGAMAAERLKDPLVLGLLLLAFLLGRRTARR